MKQFIIVHITTRKAVANGKGTLYFATYKQAYAALTRATMADIVGSQCSDYMIVLV